MKKISAIYSIIHIASGKSYVGSALDSEKRWSEHRSDLIHNCHDNKRLQNAWNKYGENAFEFKILEILDNPINLLEREQYWMDKFQSYDRTKGYNIRKIAESNFGLKHTPETIQKIRKNGKGTRICKGELNPFFGKKHSEESKQKMKDSKINPDIWEIRTCLQCTNTFTIRKCTLRVKDRKFCSLACAYKFKTKPILVKICEVCTKSFETKRFEARFCSLSCTSKYMLGIRWAKNNP